MAECLLTILNLLSLPSQETKDTVCRYCTIDCFRLGHITASNQYNLADTILHNYDSSSVLYT